MAEYTDKPIVVHIDNFMVDYIDKPQVAEFASDNTDNIAVDHRSFDAYCNKQSITEDSIDSCHTHTERTGSRCCINSAAEVGVIALVAVEHPR